MTPKGKIEATIKARNEAIVKKLEKPIPLRVQGLPLGKSSVTSRRRPPRRVIPASRSKSILRPQKAQV